MSLDLVLAAWVVRGGVYCWIGVFPLLDLTVQRLPFLFECGSTWAVKLDIFGINDGCRCGR